MANASWTEISNWIENDVKEAKIVIRRTSESDLQVDGFAYEAEFVWFSPNQVRKFAIVQGNSMQEVLSKAKVELGG